MDWKENFKHYSTTVSGLAAAFFSFVLFAPEHFAAWPVLIDLAKFGFAGGLAALGISAISYFPKGK